MLYQEDTEMLFPARVIPSLANLRGEEWKALVERVACMPQDHPDILGFTLMMIRLDGCMTCTADSYRAMRGCTLCAQQAISRFKGNDRELVRKWERARQDILCWLEQGIIPDIE
jgi:hypothetical protein